MKHPLPFFSLLLALLTGVGNARLADAQSGCAASLNAGLQVWLPLDETTGLSAVDASGQGYKGELSATNANWQPAGGANRGALSLASGGYLRLPLYWQPTSFTVSWWVNPSQFVNYGQTVAAQVSGTGSGGWGTFLCHSDANGAVYVGTDLGNRITLGTGTLSLNTWQHLTFTFSSSTGTSGTGRFYRNGQLLATKSGMAPPATWYGVSLGSATNASLSFRGLADELRVYNRALSEQEVQQLTQCRPLPPQLSLCAPLQVSAAGEATIAAGGTAPLQATPSVAGSMLRFDGVDDNLEISTRDGDPRMIASAYPAIFNNFTMEAWVLPTATHKIDPEMTQYGGLSGGQRWAFTTVHGGFYYGDDHATVGVSVGTNGVSVYEAGSSYFPAVLVWQAPTPLTSWTHVAVVYVNRQPSLFINGQLVKQATVSVPGISRGYVHPSPNLGGGTYQGSIDEVRVWNVARPAADIALTKNNVFTSPPSSLLGYWRLDEGRGQVTRDLTTQFNDGHLKGGGGLPGPNASGPIWAPSTAPLTGVNTEGTLALRWTPSTSLSAATGPVVTASPAVTTTYVVQATTACGSTAQGRVTVTVTPATPAAVLNSPVNCVTPLGGTAPPSRGSAVDVINFVRTYVARQAFTDPAALTAAGPAGVQVKTEYLDGLGRPVQTVLRQESPFGRDVVQPVAYDALGRQAREYLPYVSGGTSSGTYHPDALKEQDDFYRTTNQAGPGLAFDNTVRTGFAYAEKQFEASPLNRVTAQTSPGENWATHPVGFQERANTAADAIARCTVSYDATTTLTYQGSYAAGELWLRETADEDQRRVRTFTDKQAHVVAKLVESPAPTAGTICGLGEANAVLTLQAPAGMVLTGIQTAVYGEGSGADCASYTHVATRSADVTAAVRQQVAAALAGGTASQVQITVNNTTMGVNPSPGVSKQLRVTATYAPAAQWLATYYVYDDFERLRAVLPPKASALLAATNWNLASAEVNRLLFRYRYDARGRQVAKQLPDQDGEQQVVYNQLDQPVLTQDAQQRTRQQWSWTKYDALGRVVLTGLTTRTATADQLQQQADQLSVAAAVQQAEQRTTTAPYYYSTTQAYPRLDQDGFSASQVLGVTSYDDYNFDNDAAGTADASYLATYDGQFTTPPVADSRVTGLVTQTRTRVLGVAAGAVGEWLTSTTFYDDQARPVQVISLNARGGQDVVTSQFDFQGKRLKSYAVHNGPNHAALPVVETYAYDAAGRVLEVRQQVDNEPAATLVVANTYNELGQLARKVLGPNTALQQQLDYTYNSRGWLQGLNEDLVTGATPVDVATDLWGLRLSYDCGFLVPQYNGNISGQQWRNKADGVARAYGYLYDKANRLTRGDYVAQAAGGAWSNERQNFGLGMNYDANGNVQRLVRNGLLAAATRTLPNQFGRVDQLAYTYQGNRLLAVDDTIRGNALAHAAGYNGAQTSLAGDFLEKASYRQSGLGEYDYDANGSMVRDANKGIASVRYNHLNLPELVKFTDQDYIEFRYAATGQKVAKRVFQAGKPMVQSDYLNGYQYEDESLRFFPHSEGRVLRTVSPQSGQVSYQREYTIKDHLGNLRLAYRQGLPVTYTATLEATPASRASQEEQDWDAQSLAATRTQVNALARTGSYVASLNAAAGKPIGPLKLLAVQKGDTVRVTAPGYYPQRVSSGSTYAFSLLGYVAQLVRAAPAPVPAGEASRPLRPLALLNVGLGVVPALAPTGGGVPRGYVRLLAFNQDSVLVSSQTRQLSSLAGTGYEELSLALVAPTAGYVEAYVGNESEVDVYFDDVSLDYRPGLQVQEVEYDPAGLELAGVTAPPPGMQGLNNYRFNGKELQADLGLGWNHQDWRFFDSQLMRWHAVDPEIENGQESWTPYSFGYDNALRYADVNGRAPDGEEEPGKPKPFKFNYSYRNQDGIHIFRGSVTNGVVKYSLSHIKGSVSNLANVSDKGAGVIAVSMAKAKINTVDVTSTHRTPSQDAAAMYSNASKPNGIAEGHRLYGRYGDKVVDTYAAASGAGLNRAQTISRMTATIMEIGPTNVSHHAFEPAVLNVIDMSARTLGSKAMDFNAALLSNSEIHPMFSPYTLGHRDPAFHVEILPATPSSSTPIPIQ